MKKFKERIYIKKWLTIKPYDQQAKTDLYYLRLANDVKKAFLSNEEVFQLFAYLNADEVDMFACFLTSYFEDVISQTNIWNSFVRLYSKLYGSPLPFYDTSEYYEEEINVQDVSFLIWYFMNSIQGEQFFSPVNDFIIDAAALVIDIFDEAWEYAPENDLLQSHYGLNEGETDFYAARNLIDSILFKTYLFYPDTAKELYVREMEIVEDQKDDENLLSYLNENHDHILHNAHTRLLGLKGSEWVAEIIGVNHPSSSYFSSLSPKIKGYFLYKGQNETHVFIEHIATGKKFNLSKKSFDHSHTLIEIDTVIYMGIVKWMEEWWFSGIFFTAPFNADLIMDEKNSIESRKAVNFLNHQDNKVEEVLTDQFIAFKSFNNGSQIAFIQVDQVDTFIRDFMEFYNKSLNRSVKEFEEAKTRARKEGFFGNKKKEDHQFDERENALVFFNPKSGTEIGLDVASAFPAKDNPFFNEEESQQAIINLILSEELSPELVMFCIDNYKHKLPFLQKHPGKLYAENIDFILRFAKRKNYFTKPEITFTGGPK